MSNISPLRNQEPEGVAVGPDLRRRLVALTKVTADDKVRPILAAVAFRPDGAWATDSYRLGHVRFETHLTDLVLVPAKRLAKALREAKKDDRVRLVFDHDAVQVVIERELSVRGRRSGAVERLLVVTIPYTEGEYPNVDSLVPDWVDLDGDHTAKLAARNAPSVSAEFVRSLADLAEGADKARPVIARGSGRETPLSLFDESGRWVGLVMTRRYGGGRS